ncbi:MAG: RNA polymerase sigma factor [Desulfobacteraceae bacterium]|nr:RNA polymerase sigma factor [Desulfobacteraceae bacterium]
MEFFEIYHQYYGRVRSYILTTVRDEWAADDLTQETFIRVQKNLDSVNDPSKLASWIFRIAYNLCRDHFRSSRTKASSNEREFSETTDGFKEAIVQKRLEQDEMSACVRRVLSRLPEPLRTVIDLFDMAELSHREIADILGITVENVKVRLHRGRKQLKALLEKQCTFETDERNVLTCEPVCGSNTNERSR